MNWQFLTDSVVIIHAAFVLFVVFGGIAVLRWRRLALLHLPAVLWGVFIELSGWICPLTFVENHLRRRGGGAGYGGTFIERYLEPIIYPLGLTRHHQLVFGALALLINLAIYACIWRRRSSSPDAKKADN